MPLAQCTFVLNSQPLSVLTCGGLTAPAYSGRPGQLNNATAVTDAKRGPLPKGRYYIVDEPRVARLGWLKELKERPSANAFALYRSDGAIDDWTYVDGLRRGRFRLHPIGSAHACEGCITVVHPKVFDRLATRLRASERVLIPGTSTRYYGMLDVK